MNVAADLHNMCAGPMGTTVTGPDGSVRGIWDMYDKESPFDREMPRFVSQLETFVVFALATADVGTLAKRSTLTKDGTSYTVREVLRVEDGLMTELYLVATT